jgi:hypothetical protein
VDVHSCNKSIRATLCGETVSYKLTLVNSEEADKFEIGSWYYLSRPKWYKRWWGRLRLFFGLRPSYGYKVTNVDYVNGVIEVSVNEPL